MDRHLFHSGGSKLRQIAIGALLALLVAGPVALTIYGVVTWYKANQDHQEEMKALMGKQNAEKAKQDDINL